MLLGIDHVAVVVANLDVAIASYERLGFDVIRGGRHPNGSHNAFMSFSNGSVLELFGFLDPAVPNEHRYWGDLQRGEGLVDWCMESDALDQDAARFRTAGFTLGEPIERSRTRPDGMELRWRVAITLAPLRGVVPFLIQDLTPRSERIPPPSVHANGCAGITELIVAVANVDRAATWCETVLGQRATPTADTLGTGLSVLVGQQHIRWLAPSGADSALARHVSTRGECPFALRFGDWTAGAGAGAQLPDYILA